MKRQIHGLSASTPANDIPEGPYLVRVERARYRWHKLKPFYELSFYVLQPEALVGGSISARLYCSPKALWKLAWFLRDFSYSRQLLEQDEIDIHALVGLQGVVQISFEIINGCSSVKLNAFAPATDWEHLVMRPASPEVA